MIPVRSARFMGVSPPPPVWLDPNALGARAMVEVPFERLRVIPGGAEGLLDFLRTDSGAIADWDAFVIESRLNPGEAYVYSREQFRLAAGALVTGLEEDDPAAFLRKLAKNLMAKPQGLGDLLKLPVDDFSVVVRQAALPEEVLVTVACDVFDLHEFGVSQALNYLDKPDRSAFMRVGEQIAAAYVPDTKALKIRPARFLPRRKSGPAMMPPNFLKPRGERARPPEDRAPMMLVTNAEPESGESRVERIPHLQLSAKGPLPAGQKFSVKVFVDDQAPAAGEATTPVRFDAPADLRELPVQVWLVATAHFSLQGPDTQTIVIKRDEASSTVVEFPLEVVRLDAAGEPRVTAIFQYGGRPCGSVSVRPPLQQPPGGGSPPVPPSPRLEIDPRARPADLTVTITNPSRDERNFSCRVATPHLPDFADGQTEKWALPDATGQIMRAAFEEFTTADDHSAKQRIAGLRGAGLTLFKAAPELFKTAFWRLVGAGKLRTISIVSDESNIPWELMIPWDRVNGAAPRAPLGVEFTVGRWITDQFASATQRVPLKDSWVFAPRYPEGGTPTPLEKAGEEAQLVLALFPGAEIAPANFDPLETAMAAGTRSLMHFVCHGVSPELAAQAIYCQDGTKLYAHAVAGAEHLPGACARGRPLVFLNACEVGRLTPALFGTGGFPSAFISVGASAVIAPLWSVRDDLAHEVAGRFYAATKADPTRAFADILRTLRREAYVDAGEDTYAAYCYYGDPLAAQR